MESSPTLHRRKRSDHYLSLHRAVENNDVAKVHKLLLRGEDAAQADFGKNTPLLLAIKASHHRVISLILKHAPVALNAQDAVGRTGLYHAAQTNNLSCVVRLMARKVDPNIADMDKVTPLMVACRLGHVSMVKQIVRHTATDLDLQDACGRTALCVASFFGHDKIVDELLEHYASTSLGNDQGQTPLLVAAEQGHLQCVHMLLDHRSNPDDRDKSGRTALQYACERGDVDMVKLLVQEDVNAMARNPVDDSTMLILCARKGYLDMVHFFLLHPDMDVNAFDCAHRSALYYACQHPDVFEILERHGANVFAKDYSDKTILMRACEVGSVDIVSKMLTYAGVDVNALDNEGYTALIYASLYGKTEVVSLLLDHGADPLVADNDDETPLANACMFGQEEVVACFLSRSQDVGLECVNGQWMTCLHHAARRGHVSVVKLLLEAGVSSTIQDMSGKTPLHLACEFGHVDVVQALLQPSQTLEIVDKRDAAQCTALYHACDQNSTECALLLLELHANAECKGEHGMTPLMAAASYGNDTVVEALCHVLDTDAINARSDRGHTALYVACEGKHTSTALYLLQKGADASLCSNMFLTPLIVVAMMGNLGVAEGILQSPGRVSLDFQDSSGLTALYHACLQGHEDMVALLLRYDADVLLASDTGVTPLIASASDGHEAIVHRLLTHAAQKHVLSQYVNLRDETMQTALHRSVGHRHVRIVQQLIHHGAQVHTVDRRGHTPLMTASIKCKMDSVRCLLDHPDTQVNYTNRDGKTALYFAITYCRVPLVHMLLRHGADMAMLFDNGVIWTTGFTDFPGEDLIRVIFNAPGVDLDAMNPQGQTTLYMLATRKENRTHAIEHLLRMGANPWLGPMCTLPVVVAKHRRTQRLLGEYMHEPTRLLLLQKARVLHDIYREYRYIETPPNVAKRLKCMPSAPRFFPRRVGAYLPLPHLSLAQGAKQMDDVLTYVVTAMNDDVFHELCGFLKLKWDV